MTRSSLISLEAVYLPVKPQPKAIHPILPTECHARLSCISRVEGLSVKPRMGPSAGPGRSASVPSFCMVQRNFTDRRAKRPLACTASNQIESAVDHGPWAIPSLAYTRGHAGICSASRPVFRPSYSYQPLTASQSCFGPAKAWRHADCFAAEACRLLHSPCPVTIITVPPPLHRGRVNGAPVLGSPEESGS